MNASNEDGSELGERYKVWTAAPQSLDSATKPGASQRLRGASFKASRGRQFQGQKRAEFKQNRPTPRTQRNFNIELSEKQQK